MTLTKITQVVHTTPTIECGKLGSEHTQSNVAALPCKVEINELSYPIA